jgi:hypothetical protein
MFAAAGAACAGATIYNKRKTQNQQRGDDGSGYGDDGDFGGVLLARWRCLITS